MTYQEVMDSARQKCTKCKVCNECNGMACRGMVPGPGSKGNGKSFTSALDYLRNIDIMMDPIYDNSKGQDLSSSFFGIDLSMPVMGAPCGGAAFNFGVAPEVMDDHGFVYAQISGAKNAGTMGWIPDGPANMTIEGYLDVAKTMDGIAIPTIKPWKNERIIELIKIAESYGVPAIACDVDSAGLVNLKLMGTPVDPKSEAELAELVASTKLPFIIKGIVTVKAAEIAARVGAKAVVISNHGGRIIQDAPAPVSMIEEIKAAVGSDIKIIVDGGIRSGSDVFKCLALGADYVLIGRPVCHAAIGGNDEGVAMYFEKIKGELSDNMLMTGCNIIADITKDKIRNRN